MTTEKTARVTAHIAGQLRVLAFQRRVSQQAIASRSGLSRSAVNEYLNGRKVIPMSAYLNICDALDVDSVAILAAAQRDA